MLAGFFPRQASRVYETAQHELYSHPGLVLFHRLPYSCHVLPSHLCHDLDMSKSCHCGRACLSSFIQTTVTMNLHSVAHTVVLVDNMGSTEAPLLRYFCSLTCYSQFLDRHLQSIR